MKKTVVGLDVVERRRGRRRLLFGIGMFVMVFCFSFLGQRCHDSDVVEAASLKSFDPGYIISDWQMGNYQSMSEEEIQAFLTRKNPCNNTNYDYYLSLSASASPNYQWHFDNGHFICLSEELFGDGEVIGEGDTAAHILWETAQEYKINPQVLIVLLQKETGLITDPIPNTWDYRRATGYGCPDTAPCSSQYYGFKNQVKKAAALFRTVLDGGWTNYPLGENYVQYNPNASCGGSVVNIRSLATSALYRYTPYQPNDGALAAGYGTAQCGAYGNRNFYLYFEDWFGGITDDGLKWENMKLPRTMTVNKATAVIDARLQNATDEWLNDNNSYYFTKKSEIVWDGKKQTCLQREKDEGTDKCILMTRTSEFLLEESAQEISVGYYRVSKWTCAVDMVKRNADCEKGSLEEGRVLKIDRKVMIDGKDYYVEVDRHDGYGILAIRIEETTSLEEKLVSFKHPRNLLTNKKTSSIDINTGNVCKKYEAGIIRKFVRKIDYAGVSYYQNQNEIGTPCVIKSFDLSETVYNFNEVGIGEKFVDFILPRKMRVKDGDLYSIDVETGETCDEHLSAGDVQKYVTKLDIDGMTFFRTKENTDNKSTCAVPALMLSEI